MVRQATPPTNLARNGAPPLERAQPLRPARRRAAHHPNARSCPIRIRSSRELIQFVFFVLHLANGANEPRAAVTGPHKTVGRVGSICVLARALIPAHDPVVEGVRIRGERLNVAGHCAVDGTERPEPSRNLRMAPTSPMIQPTG